MAKTMGCQNSEDYCEVAHNITPAGGTPATAGEASNGMCGRKLGRESACQKLGSYDKDYGWLAIDKHSPKL